jgi:FAD/FMN-containing dehydrogenase
VPPPGLDVTQSVGRELRDELEARIGGEVVVPEDEGYESARLVWNGMIDRRPALIARPTDVHEVAECVRLAAEIDLDVAVRGGGHNVAGSGTCNGGLVIDLGRMHDVQVQPDKRRATVEGGATWADYDRATQAFGLASTGGVVSTTGVGGLTLGGGIGWLKRRYGLACDNLIGAEVVTVEGEILRADESSDDELFWGLRGGGGNFGIVTSFEFRVHPLATVLAGYVAHPVTRAGEALRFYREVASGLPDAATTLFFVMTAEEDEGLPSELWGKQVILIGACFAGDPEEGARVLEPLRTWGPPLVDRFGPVRYADFQRSFDDAPEAQPGYPNYWKAEYLNELPDEAVDTIVEHLSLATSPLCYFELDPMGGAVAQVGEDDTAFAHRAAAYLYQANAMWSQGEDGAAHISWAKDFWEAMEPFSAGGAYVNYFGDEGHERVRAAYGAAKYQRLARLKQRYDPRNRFRFNQNIRPERDA